MFHSPTQTANKQMLKSHRRRVISSCKHVVIQDIAISSSVHFAARTWQSPYRVSSLSFCLYLHMVMYIICCITSKRLWLTTWSYIFFSWSAYLRVLPGLARKRRQCVTASCEIQTAVQCSTRGGVKLIARPLGAWSPACFRPYKALISSITFTLLPSSG